jgi:hypothetical protein
MKRAFVFLLSFFLLVSCSITSNITDKTFYYKSKKRTLSLIFENDSICKLRNVFKCNDVDASIKEIIVACKYKRNADSLFLRNVKCDNNCKFDPFIEIPPQISSKCSFLNARKARNNISIGPNYLTDYQKYGLIPNIDIDTLFIIKNKTIVLFKEGKGISSAFTFK